MLKLNRIFYLTFLLLLWTMVYGLWTLTFAQEESVTITTYYPSPYGSYNELETYSDTHLAIQSGNVGIGTTNPQGKLDVADGKLVVYSSGKITVGGAGLAGWFKGSCPTGWINSKDPVGKQTSVTVDSYGWMYWIGASITPRYSPQRATIITETQTFDCSQIFLNNHLNLCRVIWPATMSTREWGSKANFFNPTTGCGTWQDSLGPNEILCEGCGAGFVGSAEEWECLFSPVITYYWCYFN